MGVCTFGFDLESSPDQSKERGVEGDCAVAVQRHVHAHQPLQSSRETEIRPSKALERVLRRRGSTLHAARWGQNLPKPSGGWMRRSRVTTSRCLILPLSHQISCSCKRPPCTWEREQCSGVRGLGVVFCPDLLKLVQMVRTEEGPVPRQVIKVVHDHSDKQVQDLKRCR